MVSSTARMSGIECERWISSSPKGPALTFSPAGSSFSGASESLCSSSFERTMAIVSRPP